MPLNLASKKRRHLFSKTSHPFWKNITTFFQKHHDLFLGRHLPFFEGVFSRLPACPEVLVKRMVAVFVGPRAEGLFFFAEGQVAGISESGHDVGMIV